MLRGVVRLEKVRCDRQQRAPKTALEGGPPVPDATPVSGDGFEPQPEKARRWFDHARTYADSFNYEYALVSYASGIKLDPAAMSAHEAMYEVAIKYMNKGGEPAKSKDIKALQAMIRIRWPSLPRLSLRG